MKRMHWTTSCVFGRQAVASCFGEADGKDKDRRDPRIFWRHINTSDKVFLTKYLALMLRVGTDLLSAINILILDFDKPAMRNFLLEVRDNLSKGQPFYLAFARHPKDFSPTVINLVKAAEDRGDSKKRSRI